MNREELSYMMRNYLFAYPKVVSGNKNPKYLKYIADRVQFNVERKTKKKKMLLISAPPRHGKSQLLGVHAPPFFIAKYPKMRVIMASYAASLAVKHSAEGRDLFALWGPTSFGAFPSKAVFKKDEWETTLGGGMKAVGIGSGTTGFGADLFIIDDYHKDAKEAESITQREGVWSWWQSVAATRLHPNATVCIFATRWHEDDLIGRLLAMYKELGEEEFPFELEVINFPAIAEKDDPLGREEGEALWPWWSPIADLLNACKTVGPYLWSALFQGNPRQRGGNLFKTDTFQYYQVDPSTGDFICWRTGYDVALRIRRDSLVRHTYVDPAIETKKQNDPTGALAWGYSRENRCWLLLDRLNGRIEHVKIMEAIKRFAFINQCTTIGIENEKLGKVLVKQSAQNDRIGGRAIPFKEIPTGGLDKFARATTMANYCENGRVFFPQTAPWLKQYEDSLIGFPNRDHDEDVDCTSMAENMETKISMAELLAGRGR